MRTARQRPAKARLARAAGCAAAFALALSAAACAGGGASSSASSTASPLPSVTGPVTISFEEAMSSGTLKTTLATLTANFEKKYPDITVKLEPVDNYGDLYTDEKAQLQAGDPPTIGQAYEAWAAYYADSDAIVPITNLAGGTPSQLSGFYQGIQSDLYLPGGKLYMWPFNKSVLVGFYNGSMDASKALPAPTTYSQLAADLHTVSGGGVTGVTIYPGGSTGPAAGEEWLEVIAAADGTPVFKSNGAPDFTSAAAVDAMNYLISLKSAGALAIGGSASDAYPGEDALGNKTGFFDVSSSAGYYYEQESVNNQFPMGTVALPKGSSTAATMMAGANTVVFAKATPTEQSAAWDYMQYLSEPANSALWAEDTGYLPISDAAYADMKNFVTKNPYITQEVADLNSAIVDPPYAWIETCETDLVTAMQSSLDNGASASASLGTAQSACQAAKAQS